MYKKVQEKSKSVLMIWKYYTKMQDNINWFHGVNNLNIFTT